MTTRNLSALFQPRHIALVGASERQGSVGAVVARNLLTGGFKGKISFVNAKGGTILGRPALGAVDQLDEPIDLAVIATPPASVAGLLAALGKKSCRAAVILTAGFTAEGHQALLDAARPSLLRIIGPNCLGFLSPIAGVNASFSHLAPLKGGLAFVTQSGAIATSIIDWANGRDIGFSHILSLGDMSDVDFGDLLDFLALDAATRAILLYAETITHARKFMSAARIAARAKPVIIVKGGRSRAGARAAASHTGALAGADAVYDAAIRRAGMLRVESLRELFDAAATLASDLKVGGDRLAILTNGGGLGVLAADALEAGGGRLAALSPASLAALDGCLPAGWSHGNPIDILGDAHGDRYQAALDILCADNGGDALLVLNCPTGVSDSLEAAEATLAQRRLSGGRPTLTCWMGEATAAAARRRLSDAGLPAYETPDEAVRAFLQLADYARNQKSLYETPEAGLQRPAARRDEARAVLARVRAEGRSLLTEPEAKSVLSAYGIPVTATLTAPDPEAAAAAAEGIGGRVALKVLSRVITHKSDVGGVRLDLEPAAVAAEARLMRDRVAKAAPGAPIDGFTVQAMITRPKAQELILGAMIDPTFGPCLLVGQGGVAAEVIADRVIGLPPLSQELALDMIRRTRVARLLAGYRDRPPADLGAVARALVGLSDLIIDCPEIAELDINPLLADETGVLALDARIVLTETAALDGSADDRLAIRPYPGDLARTLETHGTRYIIRPIRPQDASGLLAMVEKTTIDDLRLRFHGGRQVLSLNVTARLSQIDYDREMALVAEAPDGSLVGVSRLAFDPDFRTGECAVLVRSDRQRAGVGRALLSDLLGYAGRRGALEVVGDILSENSSALDLVRALGARCEVNPDDPEVTRAIFATASGRG